MRPVCDATLLAVVLVLISGLWHAAGAESYLSGTEPVPDNLLQPAPARGSVAATNPPTFIWVPEPGATSYDLQYSARPDFAAGETRTVSNISLNLYHPRQTLPPGEWHWRYRVHSEDAGNWSVVRTFTIPAGVPELPRPDVGDVLAALPEAHPRLFVTPETLEDLRQSRLDVRRERWEALIERTDGMLDDPLPPEPERYPGDKWDVDLWRQYYRVGHGTGDMLEHLAFAWMMTGEQKYADRAKQHLMNFMSWDPAGTTSYKYNDEVGMPLFLSVTRAYDWMHDQFTPEERAKILEVMRIRGNEIYAHLRRIPYEANPYNSHSTRVLKFLGQASLAFHGEIPETQTWLDWLLDIFYGVYPPWGDTDGSYHEGPNYWAAYQGWALQWLEALYTATGVSLYDKPFFRNTGWWALYTFPPYAKMMPFGDGAWYKPGTSQKILMYRLSSVYQNPYFRWYTENVPGDALSNNVIGFLYYDPSIQAKAPVDVPPSRAFPDTGQVSMHNQLADGDENIMMVFRSNPQGAWSHAFADQNGFYLQAFGEALAIPSGYRPYYGSPHHVQWTWQTKAANSILVNGEGQVTRTRGSRGRLANWLFSPHYDYALGDAVEAYGGRLSRFDRHVVFLRPDVFVILDDLQAAEPSTFQWLLHSWEEMDISDGAQQALIQRGDARLLVKWVEPSRLTFSQTDDFGVDEDPGGALQWHLTAATSVPRNSMQFATALLPHKAGDDQSLPEVLSAEVPGARGLRLRDSAGEDVVLLNTADGALRVGNVSAAARVAALRLEGGDLRRALLVDGRSLKVGRANGIVFDAPVTAALEFVEDGVEIRTRLAKPAEAAVAAPSAAGSISVTTNGKRISVPGGRETLRVPIPAGEQAIRIRFRPAHLDLP